MADFTEQRKEMRRKAVEALRRTNIDSLVAISGQVRQAVVPPSAFNLSSDNSPNDKIVARSADLVAIAIWAHYALQDEGPGT